MIAALFNLFILTISIGKHVFMFTLNDEGLPLYLQIQRPIENPIKHPRWSFLRKELTAFSRELFLQDAIS